MDLSDRDRQILRALSSQIRVVTFGQLVRNYWPTGNSAPTNARRRLAELVASGLLERARVVAHPLLELAGPVQAWRPGAPRPDPGTVSGRLRSRWQAEPRAMTAYLAGRRAITLFGARALGRVKSPYQVTHDLHVSEVYFLLRRTEPLLAEAWVGEEILAPSRKDQKLPDAILHDDRGRPRLVVEFGGKYPARRVAAFHDDCEARGLPYELW
jgi:DNA-binding Lrp family transcriptional regulator